MKKIYLIAIFTIPLLTLCCETPCESISGTFTNSSEKNITIYSFKTVFVSNPFLSKTTEIKKDSSITKKGKSCIPEVTRIDFYTLLEGDSIVIDFGDKMIFFKRNEPNHFSEQKQNEHNVYVLTPDDYANATPKP